MEFAIREFPELIVTRHPQRCSYHALHSITKQKWYRTMILLCVRVYRANYDGKSIQRPSLRLEVPLINCFSFN